MQGVKDLKNQRNVGFSRDMRGLQVNVDAAYGGGGDKVLLLFGTTFCFCFLCFAD